MVSRYRDSSCYELVHKKMCTYSIRIILQYKTVKKYVHYIIISYKLVVLHVTAVNGLAKRSFLRCFVKHRFSNIADVHWFPF